MDAHKIITQNKDVYDRIAPLFAQTRQYLWDDLKPLEIYIRNNMRVLDLGCGTGRLYHLFEKFQDITYIGVDQSSGQLDMAREEFPDNEYIEAEMTELPFDDEEFDIIYCIATFHHLPDEETRLQSLREMKRVLKPGGRIIMTNWNLYSDSVQKTVAKGKLTQDGQDFMVPWISPEGKILGERYYYGFLLDELAGLFEDVGLVLEDQYFSHKGERADVKETGNIVSVVRNAHE